MVISMPTQAKMPFTFKDSGSLASLELTCKMFYLWLLPILVALLAWWASKM